MSRDRERLDTLLRVRRLEEDQAKAELARANEAHRAAQRAVDRAEETYAARQHAIPEGSIGDFLRQYNTLRTAAMAVVASTSRCEEASAATEQARGQVREASMRSEGLQRLVDRAAQARADEILAAEQRTAEESRAGKKPRGRR